MIKIIAPLFLLSSLLFAACPPCNCSESISPTKSREYQTEIERVIEEKINPKIDIISEKANKAKELQEKLNAMLEQYKNMEMQNFVLNKQKNFHLENISKEVSVGQDLSMFENRVISERIKSKIELMSSYQSKDIEKDIESYLKK